MKKEMYISYMSCITYLLHTHELEATNGWKVLVLFMLYYHSA